MEDEEEGRKRKREFDLRGDVEVGDCSGYAGCEE